jgi:chromosome segregation ATPase
MINNDSANIPLNESDKKKLGLVQNRLTVLQEEVLSATKNLDAMQRAIEEGAKNKEYYDTLVASLEVQVQSLKSQKAELEEQVQKSTKNLANHENESSKIASAHVSMKESLDSREAEYTKTLASHTKESERLSRLEKEIAVQTEKIQSTRDAFKKAIEIANW